MHDRRDFFPFGEEIAGSATYSRDSGSITGYNASDPASSHLFTAKERDEESGLDYFGARYFGASLGRFTSPDAPFLDQYEAAPQSWNLYAYVRNNPLIFVDLTGEDCVYTGDQSGSSVTVTVERGDCTQDGGNFVDGTVDVDSFTYSGSSLDFGYVGASGDVGAHSIGFAEPLSLGDQFIGEMSRRGGASKQFIGAFMVSSAVVGATGGAAAYYSGATSGSGLTTLGVRSGHGAYRLAIRGFSEADVALTRTGNVLRQADGAKVYVKELGGGKFNVIVEGERGVVSALKNISQKALDRLAANHGWK